MKPNIPVFRVVNACVGAAPCFWVCVKARAVLQGDVDGDNSLRPRAAASRTPLVPPRQQVQGCGRQFFKAIHLLMALENLSARLISGRENAPSARGCQVFSGDEPALQHRIC